MDEFDLIAAHFAPLSARAPGAFGLLDDAALLATEPGEDLVVTTDMVLEGVHFRPQDPLDAVAQKALRVNLSDLAAKGAAPRAYLLGLAWPATRPIADIAQIAEGLRADQATFGVDLIGGDTTRATGPLTLAITAFGVTPRGRLVRRAGARPGDGVYVTGTIGDGALGLKAANGELAGLPGREALQARYVRPEPRVDAAAFLRAWAHAAADVSDGLLADAGHVARASKAALVIDLDAVPLSDPAASWVSTQPDRAAARAWLASAGDDYEIVFCAPQTAPAPTPPPGAPITRIGVVEPGEGVHLRDAQGRTRPIAPAGFTHF